jgi:hypothetical protein
MGVISNPRFVKRNITRDFLALGGDDAVAQVEQMGCL